MLRSLSFSVNISSTESQRHLFTLFFLISALLPSSQLAFDHQTEIDARKSISTLKALSMSKRDSRGEEKSSSGNINRDQDRRTESNDFFHIILSRTSRMSLIPERGGI